MNHRYLLSLVVLAIPVMTYACGNNTGDNSTFDAGGPGGRIRARRRWNRVAERWIVPDGRAVLRAAGQ